MAGYIERRREGYYAVVEVPPSLRPILGRKRLRKTLATKEHSVAKARIWAVVAELKASITDAKRTAEGDPATREARLLRDELRKAQTPDVEQNIRDVITDRARELLGRPVGQTFYGAEPSPVFDPQREKVADAFHLLATGQATPVGEHVERWLSESDYTPRTAADHRRAVERLKAWGVETIESVTPKKAGDYVSALIKPVVGADPAGTRKTAAKYKSSLSSYWAWMKGRGLVDFNPWVEQRIAKRRAHLDGADTKERAFTDDELAKLLRGPADPLTADLIRMGALSGMRIDELCRLTVADCEGGVFRITKAKTPAGLRSVPIHPDLKPIVMRRCKGKPASGHLFSELPAAPAGRERSMPAVKRFGRYIRALDVAVLVEGKRRSLVNFHSLRRWFVTKAEQAGQPESTIACVVGHARQGMTLGVYSHGPALAQYRACVESVRLPQHRR